MSLGIHRVGVSSLGFTKSQVKSTLANLRLRGCYITSAGYGGLLHLVTLEQAADHWASGREAALCDRVLRLLMEGPQTKDELDALLPGPYTTCGGAVPRQSMPPTCSQGVRL